MYAEESYLFRHTLMRDVAYRMQMPQDRAGLNELALRVLEDQFDGRAPDEPLLSPKKRVDFTPHLSDSNALEMAGFAASALEGSSSYQQDLKDAQFLYLRRAAELAERTLDTATAMQLWRELAQLATGSDSGEALRRCADVLFRKGEVREAEAYYRKALGIAEKEGNKLLEGTACGGISNCYRETGKLVDAEQFIKRALDVFKAGGELQRQGIALSNLGILYNETGRPDKAEHIHEMALSVYRVVEDRYLEGVALGNLAVIYNSTGRLELAEDYHKKALSMHRKLGNRRFEGVALGNLVLVYRSAGRIEEADQAQEQALSIHREVGNRRSEGVVLGNKGIHHVEAGQLELAEEPLLRALEIHRETANRRFEGIVQCNISTLRLKQKRLSEAESQWRLGVGILVEIGDTQEVERKTRDMKRDCAEAKVEPFRVPELNSQPEN